MKRTTNDTTARPSHQGSAREVAARSGVRLAGLLAASGLLAAGAGPPAHGAPFLAALAPTPLAAQATPSVERGAAAAGLALRQLDGVKRVLMIGAHPDDEDTSLLAALARGHGARTAYLSLTRGGGGQNLIGPELDEGLGVIRTGELVAARELDGGRQYFTRARDYGYSKNAEEAFSQWDREALLRDVVWVVRSFRPQVIVSVFSGTPSDGHGQHEAAGVLAHEAFDAAADPARFADQLTEGVGPWQADRLYRGSWADPGEASTRVAVGVLDPLLGRSWYQLAMDSRSQHRSQDMGSSQPLGPRDATLIPARTAPGMEAPSGDGFFAGVDTTLASRAEALPPGARGTAGVALQRYRDALARARSRLNALAPWEAVPALAEAAAHLGTARRAVEEAGGVGPVAGGAGAPASDLWTVLAHRAEVLDGAIRDAAGIVVEARSADDLLVPGQEVVVEVELWNGGPYPVRGASPRLELPAGWSAEPVPEAEDRGGGGPFRRGGGSPVLDPREPGDVEPGASVRWRYRVRVPVDAEPSELYYLEQPLDGAMYRWPDDPEVRALPRDPALMAGRVAMTLEVGGAAGAVALEPRVDALFEDVDPASGEFTHPVLVVPALSVEAQPRVMVVPVGDTTPRPVTVNLRAFTPGGSTGTLRLEAPPGWRVEPASVPFAIEQEGREQSAAFTVHPAPDAATGRFAVAPAAETDGGEPGPYTRALHLIDYPHIQRAPMLEDGAAAVTVTDVRVTADRRIGYVMGSGDDGPEALRQLGADVEILAAADLRDGDLSRFGVIVTGVRAYEVRTDLQANNERLLDWARAGGTLVVQYNKYEFPQGDFAPYPVDMSRPHDRVTDEGSPVRFIEPGAPVLTTPNRIDQDDFEGWVTERGLYFLGEWDDRFVPVLEMEDPGEAPKRGSLLVAPLGEGLYVYTGLSFFRQLPAGVAGAYRLFANLVSLDAESWNGWMEGRGAEDVR